MKTKKILALLVTIIMACAVCADLSHCQVKIKPDSTVQRVAIKDVIAGLEQQQRQVQDNANAQYSNLQGQITLLKLLEKAKQDSINVPR